MTFDFSAVTFPVADHLNRGDCTDMRLEGNLIIISTRYSYSDLKVYIHIHCMVSLKRRLWTEAKMQTEGKLKTADQG